MCVSALFARFHAFRIISLTLWCQTRPLAQMHCVASGETLASEPRVAWSPRIDKRRAWDLINIAFLHPSSASSQLEYTVYTCRRASRWAQARGLEGTTKVPLAGQSLVCTQWRSPQRAAGGPTSQQAKQPPAQASPSTACWLARPELECIAFIGIQPNPLDETADPTSGAGDLDHPWLEETRPDRSRRRPRRATQGTPRGPDQKDWAQVEHKERRRIPNVVPKAKEGYSEHTGSKDDFFCDRALSQILRMIEKLNIISANAGKARRGPRKRRGRTKCGRRVYHLVGPSTNREKRSARDVSYTVSRALDFEKSTRQIWSVAARRSREQEAEKSEVKDYKADDVPGGLSPRIVGSQSDHFDQTLDRQSISKANSESQTKRNIHLYQGHSAYDTCKTAIANRAMITSGSSLHLLRAILVHSCTPLLPILFIIIIIIIIIIIAREEVRCRQLKTGKGLVVSKQDQAVRCAGIELP
ncbi:hypothetical protein BKA70DRAFT_1398580 [Coprinopsis sp. MPI-PUGE-AT-0042]|nr:hypothetical protein BKA70DRAFT_1398580 [Coprinopsis sp. MPI-PUGE-AT-0042]